MSSPQITTCCVIAIRAVHCVDIQLEYGWIYCNGLVSTVALGQMKKSSIFSRSDEEIQICSNSMHYDADWQ